MTPLLVACATGHTRVALRLLKAKVQLHLPTSYGCILLVTPSGSKAYLKFVDLNNYNALYHACKGDHWELLKILLDKAPYGAGLVLG